MEATRQRPALDLDTYHPPFRHAAVLGAGTMGAQIAAHLANAGLTVDLLDVAPSDIGREGPNNSIVEKAWKTTQKLSPDPLFTKRVAERVRLGNFADDFARIEKADWIIEVVVERLDVKRQVMKRISEHARPDAVISTNTSGIPIGEIASELDDDFRRRFLGTHFFNPPRYLKLLELIPTDDTDADVLNRVAYFGRVHLGKGIVVANDVPYFVGNRLGVYAMMGAMEYWLSGDYTIEEIDTLTGTLVGHPKSATFRTADVVGLDVLKAVADTLYEKAPNDESRDRFQAPDVLNELVKNGALGAKTRAGFYKKEGKSIKSIDPASGSYADPKESSLDVSAIKKAGSLPDRMRALWADDGRAGRFFRRTTRDLMGYAARRIPEITDRPSDADRAIEWGFGWEMGPFRTWDALGFQTVLDDLREHDIALPEWVDEMASAGHDAFYRDGESYVPGQGYIADARPADEFGLTAIKSDDSKTLWKNDEAALLDIGDGVALFEFRSRSNSLGRELMSGLMECIDKVENDRDLRGMVIGNEGTNFAVGANLGEVAMAAAGGMWDMLEQQVAGFQQAMQRIRYSPKPVVTTVHQKALGGGCEMVMASPHPVAAAESYIGLVELGVGLIPAGTGSTRLAALASRRAPNGHPSEVQNQLQPIFEAVAMANVATSAVQAKAMGFMAEDGIVVMNAERRFHVARAEVVRLSEQGYLAPPVETHIQVLGRDTAAAFGIAVTQFLDGNFVSEYDAFLAAQFAHVLTGGDLTGPQFVHEDYLIELEREVFMRLLGETKTQERITGLLTTGKPLRN